MSIKWTPNGLELAQLVEFGEAEACADMQLAAAASLGIRVERIGSAIALVASQIPIMLFNRVVGLGLREPATEAMLDDVVAIYREAGVTRYAVQISPAARPAELPAWLEARGLSARDNWAKVYRSTTMSPPPSTYDTTTKRPGVPAVFAPMPRRWQPWKWTTGLYTADWLLSAGKPTITQATSSRWWSR